ncbi:alpha/beta fold hydrolase [Verrucomicrobia bacterium]|nr:alpha/beta fold hydrolase [Verrucomicrobiota bacterium]
MVVFSRELYPFTGKYWEPHEGIRQHYLDEGEGDPMVMVHGNPTWSFYYRNLVSQFSGRYRVIVPDHVGCGLSDKPAEDRYDYTFSQRVDDLERLLDHLSVKGRVTLFVHDWGGMIGMAWAVRNPEKVKRLVIFNTGAFPLPKTKPLPASLKFCRSGRFGRFLVRRLNAFSLAAVSWCATRAPLSPEVRQGYLAPYDTYENRVAVLKFVQDIPLSVKDRGYDLVVKTRDGLKQFVDLPAIICWGAKDFVFDDHFLDEWKRQLPKAELNYFKESGHYVLDDSKEEISTLVEDFIKRHPLEEEIS